MYSQDESAPGQEPEYEGYDLDKLKKFWREWVDVYGPARDQSFRDQEYYDGDVKGNGWGQWTTEQLQKLSGRSQPPTTRNHVARKVHAVAGVEQRSRAEPRALPRTPKDQRTAEVATDSLRFAKERARLNITSQLGLLDLLIAGYCGSEIEGAKDALTETHLEWRDIAFDPLSRRHDFSDARWLATGKWLDADAAKENYAGPEPQAPKIPPRPEDPAQAHQWALMAQAAIGQYQKAVARRQKIIDDIDMTAEGGRGDDIADSQYDDHPLEHFGDRARKRVFVVDMWHRDPKHGWYRCVFTGSGKLFSEPANLVEMDEWGRKVKVPPLKFQALFISKDGYRYGIVRGMRSPQDEVNFRLSKALHWLMVNQIIYELGALQDQDVEAVRREAAKPDGVIGVAGGPDKLRIERGLQIAAALAAMQADAEAFLEQTGPNPQLQGEQGRATSGRAVLALQQAGLGQLGPVFDRFHDWEDRRYRSYWYRIQQFWTGPQYVRVTDDKNAAKFAAVNGAPVLDEQGQPKRRAPMMGAMPPQGQMPMQGGAMQPPPGMMMQPGGSDMAPQDPRMMLGANGGPPIDPSEFETGPMLAELDMDIIIDRAPEAATLQAEQYEQATQLAQAGVFGPPSPDLARLLVTWSAAPNKTELLELIDQMKAKPQGPSPQEKAMLEKLAKEIDKIVSETRKNNAQAAKTAAEIPGVQAENAAAGAQARSEHVNATMNEIGASDALSAREAMMVGAFNFAPPPAAADQSGALGLPPSEANGPPPF